MSPNAPDIYVVPPAEDSAAPWCCYSSRNDVPDDDDDEDSHSVRYIQASHRTPYFHRTMLGPDGLILPSRKSSSDTQSIVDALGDADEFTDDEMDQVPMDPVPEEDEEEDGDSADEMGVARESRSSSDSHSNVGNDSDIIEVFKVRRRSMRAAHTYDNFHGTLGSSSEFNQSSLRFRATKAFRSLRGAVRPPPISFNAQDSTKVTATSNTKPISASRPHTKLKPKPRVQDIFNSAGNIPQTDKTSIHQLSRRPSNRLAQIIPPKLRQRPPNVSFTTTSPEQSTQSSSTRMSETHSNVSPVFQQEPTRSSSRCSSSSTQTQQAFEPHARDKPNPGLNPHPGTRCFSPPPTHQTLPRSFSPPPALRSISPVPSISQGSGRFGIRKLQRIFSKSSISLTNSNGPPRVDRVSTIGSVDSTCPSLSSTHTSEYSGRTTPTLDSVPQTPTSFDENETRRTIVPLPSCSTVGSGISLGSSFNSDAVSSLASSNTVSSMSTAATRGSVFSAPVFHPKNATCDRKSEPSSKANTLSSISDGTTNSGSRDTTLAGTSNNNDTDSPLLPTPPFSEIMLSDLDLKLGLGIDLFPKDADNSSAGTGSSNPRTITTNFPRSRSLRKIGSRLRRWKEPAPPVPSSSSTESDMSMEMKLKSLHFEDLSFDADQFMAL